MDEDTPIEQDPLIGTTIEGRYKILECLGEGGMGAVYVAEHLTLHKQIALKVIHPEFAGQEAAAERFKREAMVTSRFQHPHVISAIDFGTMPDGGAFLAMELVRGRSLTEILEAEGCLPWGRACMLMSQLADALAAAKDHGIVHRDIKPDNILIARRQDGTETVKVLDFGIARFSRESLTPPNMTVGAQVTREGMIIGTPGYMSPEQSIGEPADHRSDLYALGVILWECIVGKQLWDADSLKELIRAQLATDPPSVRASADDLTLPDELEGLVTSLLKREARDRPDDAAEVRDLLRILSNMGRGSGSFSLPEAPLVERLAAMAEAAKKAEDRTPSGTMQTTPMTGEQPAPAAAPRSHVGSLLFLLAVVGGTVLVYTDQLDVALQVTPKGNLDALAKQIAPELGALGRPLSGINVTTMDDAPADEPNEAPKPVIGLTGLPVGLERHLEALVSGDNRKARVSGAEALVAHMPMEEIPGYVRVVANLQLEASCTSKKEQLLRLIELDDRRSLPALVMISRRGKAGCGKKGKDCLLCMRKELDDLIEGFENALLQAESAHGNAP